MLSGAVHQAQSAAGSDEVVRSADCRCLGILYDNDILRHFQSAAIERGSRIQRIIKEGRAFKRRENLNLQP